MLRTLALAGAFIGVFAATSAVDAQPRVEVGILSCAAGSTTGTIFAFGAADLNLGQITLRYAGTVCFKKLSPS